MQVLKNECVIIGFLSVAQLLEELVRVTGLHGMMITRHTIMTYDQRF